MIRHEMRSARDNTDTKRWYRASEFAQMTGVTVRALHHYDGAGLLKPSGRTAARHRLYGERDFARLQQIVTLKFLGFSLNQIREILDRSGFELTEAIRFQLKLLAEKKRQLNLAVEALERVEGLLSAGREPDWEFFAKIVEVVSMQNSMEWAQQYYSPEAREAIAERAKLWSPELQAQVSQQWAELIADVETAIREGVEPGSERGQALGTRSADLVAGFTGGNSAIAEGLNKFYADQGNWPSDFKKPYSDEVGAFFCAAMAARQTPQA